MRFYGDTVILGGVQEQRTTAMGRDTTGSFRITLVVVRQIATVQRPEHHDRRHR